MTPITTPFGFASTAAEVARGVDLTGRSVLVTGASSGLGAETARVLAGTGVAVTLAVRDIAAGERVAKEIAEEGVGGRYFADCNETGVVDRRTGTLHGVARYAVDPEGAGRLWTLSEEMLAHAG